MKEFKPVKTVAQAQNAIAKEYFFHPYCLKWPIRSEEKLIEMARSIKENGQENPIIYKPGKKRIIVDGRNRLLACAMAGVKPKLRAMKPGQTPLGVVLANNLYRRHQETGALTMLAADLMREEQAAPKGTGPLPGTGTTRARAAAVTGTSPRAVQTALKLQEEQPKLAEEVRAGEISLHAAEVQAKARRPTNAIQLTFADSFLKGRKTSLEKIADEIQEGLKGTNFRTDPALYREAVEKLEKALSIVKSWHPNGQRHKCAACFGLGKIDDDGTSHKCLLCDNGYVGAKA